MKTVMAGCLGVCLIAGVTLLSQAQEILPQVDDVSATVEETNSPSSDPEIANEAAPDANSENSTPEEIDKKLSDANQAIDDFSKKVDSSEQAKEVSAGILKPIYMLAEAIAFPSLYWVAFAIMATGVVSFALQLVMGKLVVLSHLGFSLKEILSDALGLAISLVGIVFTTQAAVENSTFTNSPAAVLSASAIGLVAGFVCYLWGQSQEIEAAKGRTVQAKKQS